MKRVRVLGIPDFFSRIIKQSITIQRTRTFRLVPLTVGRSVRELPQDGSEYRAIRLILRSTCETLESEFRTLFKQAGFELTSVTPTSTTVSVIEGKAVPAT